MKGLCFADVVSAAEGQYFGPAALLEKEIAFITTDSREADEGCLFTALRGERTDGHRFMESAFLKGAAAVLCEERPEREDIPSIVVSSAAGALSAIASYYRSLFSIPFIGVTGSVGKTTAKEMIAAVLSRRLKVHRTKGNFNNELGVPLTLFALPPDAEAAVIEMGISHFGEMRRLTKIVRPDMAVFTVIGDSHLQFLQDREGVLRAKSEILEGMPEDGVVFVNGDDEHLQRTDISLRTVRYGIGLHNDVRAENVRTQADGSATDFTVVSHGLSFPVRVPAYGSHMVYAALAGAAVGLELGLTGEEIAAGIAAYEPVGRRARIVQTAFCTVVDDCYNANPTSGAAALRSLAALPGRGVCILGDMLELGAESKRLHYKLGRLAAETGVRVVAACGREAQHIYEGAKESNRHVLAWYFEEKGQLIDSLPVFLNPGDTVLVKASRGMQFEEIVSAIEKMV
jgi:UDP-N-acetylmuramoyl-tripeptide--D-alanyl-D-alanine ligase